MNIMNRYGKTRDLYLELINEFPLRPIRSNDELNEAIRVLTALHDRTDKEDAEIDYEEVLGEVIDRYQDATWDTPKVSNLEVFRYLLDMRSLTLTQLAQKVDIPEPIIVEVLGGSRKFTPAEIDRVCEYLRIKPTLFAAEN